MTTPIDQSSLANAAALAAQGASSRRLDASLSKLTAAKAVKPTPTDAATVTSTNVLKAVRDAAPLRELGARLIDLRKLLAGDSASRSSAQSTAQKVVDLLAPFAQTEAPTTRLLFDDAFVDLAGDASDPDARLTLELGGPGGTREVSFSSGTSVADLAETLNTVGADIGVSARLSGNAVVLDTSSPLSAGFVGVRVIDAPGANLDSAVAPNTAIAALRSALQRGELNAPATLSLLDDAIREVEQAERERLLGRADQGLTLDEVDAPVIREAQAKLLEEARRLGLLIDHDPAKAIDALRD